MSHMRKHLRVQAYLLMLYYYIEKKLPALMNAYTLEKTAKKWKCSFNIGSECNLANVSHWHLLANIFPIEPDLLSSLQLFPCSAIVSMIWLLVTYLPLLYDISHRTRTNAIVGGNTISTTVQVLGCRFIIIMLYTIVTGCYTIKTCIYKDTVK